MDKPEIGDAAVRRALAAAASATGPGGRLDPAGFHPFPARMPIAVAECLIRRLTVVGDTVLDPMVGSGTSLVAARRLGRHGLGFDRDPLAVLVSRCAVEAFRQEGLSKLGPRVLQRARGLERAVGTWPTSLGASCPAEERWFLDYWFPAEAQRQLAALAAAIEQEPESGERSLCWVAFSGLVIAKSAGVSLAVDLSRSRPHKCAAKALVPPFSIWDRRFRSTVARLPFLGRWPRATSRVDAADARSLPLAGGEVDFALTSPPYVNAIDYLRGHKFSLLWMGHRLSQLRELRGTMMGSERGLFARDGLPPCLEERLVAEIVENRRRGQRRRYLSDLQKLISELYRTLRPDGLAVLVLGPCLVASGSGDAGEVASEIAAGCGFQVIGSAVRELASARRSLPPPSSRPIGRLDRRMREEVLLALRKRG
jgi:DNA modification methylase